MRKMLGVCVVILCLLGGVFAQGTKEQGASMASFPSKPVEAVIGWAAGGGGDVVFRAIAEVFPKYANGQPLVIKNVPGASGLTGAVEFLNAPADGYTVMHWNNASITKAVIDKSNITATTFTPVLQVVSSYNYLLVKADSKWKTLADFVKDAKANPGKITIGNAGTNGGNHVAALLFQKAVGADFVHVPYSGGGPSVTGLLAGEVDAAMNNAPEGVSQIASGQLRLLAVFSETRYPSFPNAPTAKESGYDLILPQWRGVVLPPKAPKEVVARLEQIFKQCIEDPDFVKKMESMNVATTYKNSEDFGKLLVSEETRYKELFNK